MLVCSLIQDSCFCRLACKETCSCQSSNSLRPPTINNTGQVRPCVCSATCWSHPLCWRRSRQSSRTATKSLTQQRTLMTRSTSTRIKKRLRLRRNVALRSVWDHVTRSRCSSRCSSTWKRRIKTKKCPCVNSTTTHSGRSLTTLSSLWWRSNRKHRVKRQLNSSVTSTRLNSWLTTFNLSCQPVKWPSSTTTTTATENEML